MIEKYADRPNDVASRHEIEVDMGVGNRRLYVLSGIAILSWKVNTDQVQKETLVVHLRKFVRDFEQGSAFVALATVVNDETDFLFATDEAEVKPDPGGTGELLLTVKIAVKGDSQLIRVSYQVVATAVQTTSAIRGRIFWNRSLRDIPQNDVSQANQALSIMANHYEVIPTGTIWGDSEKWTPVKGGTVEQLDSGADDLVATFLIRDPPLGMELQVTVKPLPSFAGVSPVSVVQIAGPLRFTLNAQRSEEVVDFRLSSARAK